MTPDRQVIEQPQGVRKRWIRGPVRYAVVAFLLLALGVGAWVAGGFEKRQDKLRTVAPGTEIGTGPYRMSFTEVTAERTANYQQEPIWRLTAVGTASSDDSVTSAPEHGAAGSFASRDPASRQVRTPTRIGVGEDNYERDSLTPGLPAIRFTVTFEYAEPYVPGPTLEFVVFDLAKRNPYLLGGDEQWHSTGFGSRMLLPVRVIKTTN